MRCRLSSLGQLWQSDLLPCRCETAEARLQAAQAQLEEVLAKNSQQELQAAQAEIASLQQNLVAAMQDAESFRWGTSHPVACFVQAAVCTGRSGAVRHHQPPELAAALGALTAVACPQVHQ